MAQINLLKQKSQSQSILKALPSFLVKLFVFFLVLLLAYYVWIFIQVRNAQAEIQKLGQEIGQAKAEVEAQEAGRSELLTRQAQLDELKTLVAGHIYWSQLLPALSRATLKKASYSKLSILDEGEISLEVSVPTLKDIDKFLQVFDLPEFYKHFSDIRIGAFHKVSSGDETVYIFQVVMKYNSELIQYQGE